MTHCLTPRPRPLALWTALALALLLLPNAASPLRAQNGSPTPAPIAPSTPSAVSTPPASSTSPASLDTSPAPALDPATGKLPTLLELFNTSRWINGAIAALSVVALLLFAYFVMSIQTASMAPPSFVDDLTKMVVNKQYKDAADYCRSNRSIFVASIVQRCLENAGKEHSVILDMLDSEGRRRADVVWNRVSYLADVANVAPMLGLLGTVVGMIQAFFVLPAQSATLNSRALITAIGGALSTTMFGLIVAILALIFYSLVKARLTRVLADAEQVVHSIADHIKRD